MVFLLFQRKPPCNSTSFWNLVDYVQYLLHLGEIQLSFTLLDLASSMFRHLLVEQDPLLIPHLVSIFANKLEYWSNTESRSRFHEFVVQMAAIVLENSHPITVIITLLKDLQNHDLLMLSWRRILDLFSGRLGSGHRATIDVAEAFSSALNRPKYLASIKPQGRHATGMREHWSRDTVNFSLGHLLQKLQHSRSEILDKRLKKGYWQLSDISESIHLLQAILTSNEETMDPEEQWSRHDTKLRLLLVCNQIYYHLDFPTADDRHRAKQATSDDEGPETVAARRHRTQTVFSCLHRTWEELGWNEGDFSFGI